MAVPNEATPAYDYYRTLLDSIALSIQVAQLLYDDHGEPVDYLLLDVNAEYVRFSGFTKEEIVGKKVTDLFADIAPEWFITCGEVIKSGKTGRFEIFDEPLGCWFDILAIPLGSPDRFAIVYSDISEQKKQCKKAEALLLENERRQAFLLKLTDILRSLPEEGSIQDAATRLLTEHLNASHASYCNYSEGEEAVSREIQSNGIYMTGTCSRSVLLEVIDMLLSGRDVIYEDLLEYEGVSERLRNYWLDLCFRANATVPMFEHGNLVATLSVTNTVPRTWSPDDVELVRETAERTWTAIERVRLEKVLKENEAKYRRLFETSNDGFWWADRYGYVTEANEGTAKMLGYSQEELIGRFWGDFVDNEWLDQGHKEWEARKTGASNRYEMKLKKKDGSTIWARVSGSSLQDEHREYAGTLVAFTDITEQKAVQDELRRSQENALELVSELKEANENKDEFISMLSHELRNPLATITGGVELLELTNTNKETLDVIRILKRQTAYLSGLVDDLLDITRITRKKVVLHREILNLHTTVCDAIEDMKPQFEEKGIELVQDMCAEPIVVNADALRITQCVVNVLGNALKFTQKNGIVSVSLLTEGKMAVIKIQDNGMGICPGLLPTIFEPFRQELNPDNNYHNRGLGLGLSIVKDYLEMHGGDVAASSPGLGKGSLFTMRIPIL